MLKHLPVMPFPMPQNMSYYAYYYSYCLILSLNYYATQLSYTSEHYNYAQKLEATAAVQYLLSM